jgi:hypothetical protein
MSRPVGLVFEVAQVNGSRRGRISKFEDSRHLETNTAHAVRRKYWLCLLGLRLGTSKRGEWSVSPPSCSAPIPGGGQTSASPAPSPPSLGMPLGDGRRGRNGATALHERGVQLKEGHPACRETWPNRRNEYSNKANGRPDRTF